VVVVLKLQPKEMHLILASVKSYGTWWDPQYGRQDQLKFFDDKDQFISFHENLNQRQIKALEDFLGRKVRALIRVYCTRVSSQVSL
jgi:hypothetical protein